MVKTSRKNTWLRIIMVSALLLSMFVTIPKAANAEDELNLRVKGAILIDADSGKILYEKNADKSLGIASMSKMMTEYLLLDAIKEGKITWDQKYKVSEYAYKISQNRALSNVPLRADGEYTIRELYEAMAIYSANAATIAIAETIAGSETEFVNMMNKKAKKLGLKDYTFVNSTGLNNAELDGMEPAGTGKTAENKMPAKSVAKLAYHLLQDHPEVLKTSSITKKTFREGTDDAIDMSNWNFMLPGLVFEYEGVDGLKTGTTDYAGYCFTGTASRNGTRLIAVVLDAVDAKGEGTYKARFDATRALFDYGFNQFTTEEIVPANYSFKGQKTIPVIDGKEDKVNIATKEAISIMVKTADKDLYKPKLVLDKKELNAPVKKDTVVGHVEIEKTEGKDYGFIDGEVNNAEVVTTATVEKSSWISRAFKGIGNFFSDLWNKIF
ncbi:D-alanyl-D-alanine carboxypeptidase family protein [Viridibacillus sp. NPDC093762]|uniref:D-alanyl-D-alanine carboxypeptidase family protein n=1 Tax=Viridibacillus sp. NPDC093762 TaxID=3390720 RepID=UPI003D04DE64